MKFGLQNQKLDPALNILLIFPIFLPSLASGSGVLGGEGKGVRAPTNSFARNWSNCWNEIESCRVSRLLSGGQKRLISEDSEFKD